MAKVDKRMYIIHKLFHNPLWKIEREYLWKIEREYLCHTGLNKGIHYPHFFFIMVMDDLSRLLWKVKDEWQVEDF